jgi:predicted CoA-substrate-specific enzyme activase
MQLIFGIDIGTTFITVYEKREGSVWRYRHEGKIRETLRVILRPLNDNDYIVFTGKAGREIAGNMKGEYVDEAVAMSCMLTHKSKDLFAGNKGQIIDIGASSLSLYTVKNGNVIDIARNTLCAAGTGLFLEEQAQRLNIELEELGTLDIPDPPLIASRCTVFAKSDLIHHQQEGRSKDEMWAGLCRSLVVSAVNTLFRGAELKGKIMICGGVSLNQEVIRWFHTLYPEVEWVNAPIEFSEAIIAMGASMAPGKPKSILKVDSIGSKKIFKRMPPLKLIRSNYPQMHEPVIDNHQNEIRIHTDLDRIDEVILGMDIGSTSTKLAVIGVQNRAPILDIYGKTAGDPVGAAKSVFASLYDILDKHLNDKRMHVVAFGTTGSGRKLVGEIFGADLIVNEISAHGTGTAHFYPDVETIFEIGGQDAKYISLQNGYVEDVNMNYVCAAGTGSFVEEQARKLGFQVNEIGELTANIAPPVTSDRCTVFMEQDLRALLKEGFSKEEALASVLYSIIQNYLNRVVGSRKVSDKKIFFQGATARNKGLVAAIENLMEVEVTVSPYCHVMGAFGAAIRAHDYMLRSNKQQPLVSCFVGTKAVDLEIASRVELCKLCRNFCRINFISRLSDSHIKDNMTEFSWGYQCGRDPEEKKRKEIPQFSLFKEREKVFRVTNQLPLLNKSETKSKGTITLIHALTNHTFLPLWLTFFNGLGYKVAVSGQTDSKVKTHATKIATGDFCFPVKVALGHIVKALENKDVSKQTHSMDNNSHFFLPFMIADKPKLDTAHSFFCPYVESSASIVKSMLNRNGIPTDGLLAPVVDLRDSIKDIAERIFTALKERLPVKKKEVINSFSNAYKHWQQNVEFLEHLGSQVLEDAIKTGEPVFLMVGRPYNLHDKGVNLGIPEKIAAKGYRVIPIDMLTLDNSVLSDGNYHNIFWQYGQRIISSIKIAGKYNNVFPIYLSNFNCGPDSFLLTFAESELKRKPMLILELDEHDSDGGYLTRIEAYLDVVSGYMRETTQVQGKGLPDIYTAKRKIDMKGKIWIPPLHIIGGRLYSAAFRRYGFDSQALEQEDKEALVLGKKHLRGGECLPMTLTLGAFLKTVKHKSKNERHILFMPTTEGPCRFGQYNLLDRIVFDRLGLENVDVLSPSSINSYQGLPNGLRRQLMHATITSDILFKMLTKVRPYERNKGDADECFEKATRRMEEVLEHGTKPLNVIRDIASQFAAIPIFKEKKPLVGIVGEIYVRCNASANGDLVDMIETNGGEAWLAPVHEWLLYVAYMQSFAARNKHQNLLKRSEAFLSNFYFFKTEKNYYDAAHEVLFDREEPHIKEVVQAGAQYLPQEFEGEAILTVGRAIQFAQMGADLVVNAAPFGCMPGTLSSSILLEIKEKFKIPFISLFYDGDIDVNDKVASLLKTISIVSTEKDQDEISLLKAYG